MVRPLRLQFAGALYHVTARGNARQKIYLDATDRERFLDLLGKEIVQQRWVCYAYCLMDNHYHLLIETPEPNLVTGMQRLSGVYTQSFNHRHHRVGHLFQGRYKAILVDQESYLLEVCRYVVLNPVRAKAVKRVEQWRWSSYAGTAGLQPAPSWLAANAVLSLFANRRAYERFVAEGIGKDSVWSGLRAQIYLGGEAFLKRVQEQLPTRQPRGIARVHLQPLRPSAEAIEAAVAKSYGVPPARVLDRDNADAYKATVYLLRRVVNLSLAQVATRARISPGRVSQIQTEIENRRLDSNLMGIMGRYKVKP